MKKHLKGAAKFVNEAIGVVATVFTYLGKAVNIWNHALGVYERFKEDGTLDCCLTEDGYKIRPEDMTPEAREKLHESVDDAMVDESGTEFDPAVHAVREDGGPLKDDAGNWVKKDVDGAESA